ncbi:type VI secretion system-associated protein TagF [Sphaerotilus sp.]|uniref:type VI secretion system-associated protein TagF n=1 Tax=Sphaerotilus sp. TaxID=2093942 RepID=UPI002ACE6101|nr:type VI secretion system-associated protein TagF [Sphaerotilus sp.]MDZ7856474.1 type VI secretion system-associated protein TagF [Sphaerotilus sp.]
MAAPGEAVVCGWYGKLPAVGDFATRRLTPAMVARCDAWLSSGLAASQRELGDGWLDLYLTAPIWRFAWGPGLAGDEAWLGVLMPSVDRVGRYFPLLLAAPCPVEWLAEDALGDTAAEWLERLADTAQDCLRPGASLGSLEAALAADPRPVIDAATPQPLTHRADLTRHSLWWTHRDNRRRSPGLPDGSAFTALLHGDD